MARALLVGESEILHEIRHKGFDSFHMTSTHSDAGPFLAALRAQGHEVDWMSTERASEEFPFDQTGLADYDVVILSDVGSNTLLLPRAVHEGVPRPNRLEVLREWVFGGGALLMCGGWMSFAGMHGAARYHRTPAERALPVSILPYDDRVERPEGIRPMVVRPEHRVLAGITHDGEGWPPLLGYNRVSADDGTAVVLATDEGDPLLALGHYGQGRSAVWTSDVAPHWLSKEFSEWEGFERLFGNLILWLGSEQTSAAESALADDATRM